MRLTPIHTHIFKLGFEINELLDYITDLPENSILCITTKLISLAQNRIASSKLNKYELVSQEADLELPSQTSLNIPIATIQNILMPAAAIDESNSQTGDYILWPKDCNKAAKDIWELLQKKYKHEKFAVLLTDTRTGLMRKGTTGICSGFYGLNPLKSYLGKQDLFDKTMTMTEVNTVDSLAGAAVFIMGEGSERIPMALIEDVKADFCHTTPAMYNKLNIALEDDIYLGSLHKMVK